MLPHLLFYQPHFLPVRDACHLGPEIRPLLHKSFLQPPVEGYADFQYLAEGRKIYEIFVLFAGIALPRVYAFLAGALHAVEEIVIHAALVAHIAVFHSHRMRAFVAFPAYGISGTYLLPYVHAYLASEKHS